MAAKVRILYMTCFGSLGRGGQRSLHLLLKHLDRERFEPLLVVPEAGELSLSAKAMGVRSFVVGLPPLRSFRLIAIARGLSSLVGLIGRERIDIVATDSVRETFYAALARFWVRAKIVLHVRVTDSRPWIDRLLYRSCDHLIAVSGAAAARFAGYDVSKKVTVVYNGLELDVFSPSTIPGSVAGLRIGFFGRLEHRKGLDTLIEAIRLSGGRRMALRIHGEGEGSYPERLRHQAEGLPVSFMGFRPDVKSELEALDVVVLPSRYGEGMSRTVLESLAMGRPAVVSDTPGNPEAVGPALKEFVFHVEDAVGLAKILARFVDEPGLLRRASRHARERAEEVFDIGKNTRQIERVYEALCRRA